MENKNPISSVPQQAQSVLKQFSGPKPSPKKVAILVSAAVLVVVLAVGSGWLLSGKGKVIGTNTAVGSNQPVPGAKKSATEAGISDTKAFPDTATGTLKSGGIKGEGTHHLERDGGVSQNVYLTSSVIDLESFVGKKVQVWGQTISGKEAGWLMDVGRVKVVE